MNTTYRHALEPLRVGGKLLRNRLISGPSTMHSMSFGQPYPSENAIRFFEERAQAGVAVVTCAGVSTGPAPQDGIHASWDPTNIMSCNAMAQLAERIHLHGALAHMELMGIFPEGYGVSDGVRLMDGSEGREIPLEAMEAFKSHYIETAATMQKLGFDGILLHFGHNIPVAQFLSPLTNKRTDQYGGSTENRARYLQEILAGIRARVGPRFLIEIRISGSEFAEGGIDIEEGIRLGELLQEHINLLQVSAGMHHPGWMTITHPCGFLPPNPNVFLAEAFKQSGRIKVPVGTIGGIGSLADVEDIIGTGKADYVVTVRSLMADPDWIRKDSSGLEDDRRPCVKCMRCHDSAVYERLYRCTVNPRAGMEMVLQGEETPAAKPRKVAVVGGGPAGMQAAITAAQRGHQVTLYEKGTDLGGAIEFADHAPFKYPLRAFKDYLVCQTEKSGAELRLNTKVTPEELRTAGFDAVVTALGAVPLVPPIPGIGEALPATAVYGREGDLGDSAIVIGGGQVGCETALYLAVLGKQVTLLELQPELAPDASPTHRYELLQEMEKQLNLTIITGARCTGAEAKWAAWEKDGENHSLEADFTVLATGMKPCTDQADAFLDAAPQVIPVGDCVAARTVEWAVREGYYAALQL